MSTFLKRRTLAKTKLFAIFLFSRCSKVKLVICWYLPAEKNNEPVKYGDYIYIHYLGQMTAKQHSFMYAEGFVDNDMTINEIIDPRDKEHKQIGKKYLNLFRLPKVLIPSSASHRWQ